MARMGEDRLQSRLKSTTSLNRKGKAAIRPETIEVQQEEESIDVVFRFPKEEPIRLEDKEVEFVSRFGPLEFKGKFRMKDMEYGGGLAL
ncbi:MAG: hypothetical protein HY236_15485 [Acidobacteria bacterium]|nr:hypothetical protein [Acidobacteriota bacterium]